MKKFITLSILLLCVVGQTYAYNPWQLVGELPVGKRPSSVYTTAQGMYFVLCAGWDANKNGIQDEGDEPPSIWYFWTENAIISSYPAWASFEMPQKLIDLDFENLELPFRAVLDYDYYNNNFYIATSKGIVKITVKYEDYHPYKLSATCELFLPLKAKSISGNWTSYNSIDKLYISMQDEIENTGSVLIYDLKKNSFYDTIPAYKNVQMTLPVKYNSELFILNSDENSEDSKLQIVHIGGKIGMGKHLLLKEINIPTNANFVGEGDYVYITSFKNSNLTNISLEYTSSTVPFDMGQGKSLREIYFSQTVGNHGWISSDNGFVYSVNTINGTKYDSLDSYGKAEGMAQSELFFAIATPYQKDSFEPDTAITLYGIQPVSVNNDNNDWYIRAFPNPASDFIFVKQLNTDTSSENITLQIFDMMGIELMKINHNFVNSEDELRIDVSKFKTGVYMIKIGDKFEKFIKI